MSSILAHISRLDHTDGWISWQKDEPLLALQPYEESSPQTPQINQAPPSSGITPVLNRNQYQSVVQRFQQATKKATQFAAWTDS